MRKIIVLVKVLLKSGGLISNNKQRKARWWVPLVLLVAFASFALSIGMMATGLYDVLEPAGMAGALLPLAMGATSVMIFLFGVFYVVSVMYHADDVPLLMALPLRPYQMLAAKFITLVLYEYIFEAFLLLPIVIVYGIRSGAGGLYILYSSIVFAVLPVIALSMASVLVMIVMRFTSFGKNKQAFKFVGGIIALLLAIGLNVALQSAVSSFSAEQMAALMTGEASLVSLLERLFPGLVFASQALIRSADMAGLWNLLLFVLSSAAATAIFMVLGQLLYFKGLAGVTEAAAKRRGLTAQELGKSTARTPAVRSYVVKELRLLMRSPVAFLNCVAMNLIWPVLFLIMIFSGGQSISAVSGMVAGMDTGTVLAIIVGASAFAGSANGVTSTAISREGRSVYFMKYIPMPMEKQLYAKLMTGMLLSGISIVLLAVLAVVLGVGVLTALIALALSVLAVTGGSLAGLLIDAGNPKLDWVNEQQAIKQNVNVLLHMLAGLVFAALLVVPVLLLQLSPVLAGVYIAVVLSLACLVMWRSVAKGASARIAAMDA